MTPAIQLAKKHQLDFKVHEYQHDPQAASYGVEAANKLGIDESLVFKTLVLSDTSSGRAQLSVAVLPVNSSVNMKKYAKALAWKKAAMAQANDVMNSTGYVLGGVSPLGQKKRLPTIIHESATACAYVYVSAGKRGLELQLRPDDLARLCQARFVDIID